MINKILIGGSAFLLIGSFIFLGGCKRHHSHDEKLEWMAKKIASKLDLDDKQKTKLQEIKKEIKAKNKDMKVVRKDIYEEVSAQLKAQSIDKEKLKRILKKNEQRIIQFRYFLVDKAVDFYGILNTEQKKEVYDKLTYFGKKHGF